MREKLDFAIVLTGGIGSGKSTTSSLLRLYGFEVIDCDAIAHEQLEKSQKEIVSLFGSEYIVDGKVDRAALGRVVFNDKEAKKKLEALLHPLIRKEVYRRAKSSELKKIPYFIDIPLYFETKGYDVAKVAVVYTPKALQIERLKKRGGLQEEEILRRIKSQIDIEQKKEQADYLIDNSKDLRDLQSECEEIVKRVKKDFDVS